MQINKTWLGILILLLLTTSCKKLIQVDSPINEIVGNEIYKTDVTAASVLTGIYAKMGSAGPFTGDGSIALKTGLSADELISAADPSSIWSALYSNNLTNESGVFWNELYDYIFRVNAAIEGIEASDGISQKVKEQLIGEAKFLRALMYFYSVNLFGDVPLLLTTDINANKSAARTDRTLVYDQIVQDLKASRDNLSEDYIGPDAKTPYHERVRPNKATATALLARTYLYMEKFSEAEIEASTLISDATFQLEPLTTVFLKDSKEAIWQLQPVQLAYNTLDAVAFVLAAGPDNSPAPGPNGFSRPVYLSNYIFNGFEVGDQRRINWADSVVVNGYTFPYAYKYKVWFFDQPKTEYLAVFRLAEQYLIRAEARAHQGKISGANSAAEDLNVIRNRAGLQNTSATTLEDMLDAILHERKVELFTEGGHRWLDIKRTGKVDEIMTIVTPTKGGTWASYKSLYPISVFDIQSNPSLRGHQNPGYPEN